MKINGNRTAKQNYLAGGQGAIAAIQSPEQQLRRLVMANLLWENLAYIDGESAADLIAAQILKCKPEVVGAIALECREKQRLRHTPLFILREMARHEGYKQLVGELLPKICTRADMVTDFLALYWKDGKVPLSNQVKKGLGNALKRFDEYQLAKYDRAQATVRLRDVLFLTKPVPNNEEQAQLWARLANQDLKIPDTWEVSLSGGEDKSESWTRLINEGKLGAIAFLRNLRGMEESGVAADVIQRGFDTIKPSMLLPINFLSAVKHAPKWTRQIENLMFRTYSDVRKMPGHTVFIVDVSGSMEAKISAKSEYSRMDVAAAMAMFAAETCDQVSIYATGGSDGLQTHETKQIPAYRGFGLAEVIKSDRLGGGGIFTRQCLEFIQGKEKEKPDRIIVFSDSQDCDWANPHAKPFGKRNYIIDVSANQHGINHRGAWDAEISGWSEHFLTYISELEQKDPIAQQ